MAFVFSKDPIEIRSRKTSKVYSLVRADSITLDDSSVIQITRVCNEEIVYKNVFFEIFNGNPYTEDHARVFMKLISKGWIEQNRFDWLILHNEIVVGTIGIKSLLGEVGYWQSSEHSGVMMIALQSVASQAKDAGFSSLFAYVNKANTASINVLKGAGFELDKKLTVERKNVNGFRVNF